MDNNNDRKLSDLLPEVDSVDQQARHKSTAKLQTDIGAQTGHIPKVSLSFSIDYDLAIQIRTACREFDWNLNANFIYLCIDLNLSKCRCFFFERAEIDVR